MRGCIEMEKFCVQLNSVSNDTVFSSRAKCRYIIESFELCVPDLSVKK